MAFCRNCGNQIADGAAVCVKCGCETGVIQKRSVSSGIPAFVWGIIGFFVPIAGLILWILWKNEEPEAAKGAGLGALISTAVSIIVLTVYFLLYFVVFSAMFGSFMIG